MKALGASHLKVFLSRQREKERVAFALSRHEFGFLVHQKRVADGLLLFRSNCVGSISPASSAQTNIGSEEEIQTVNSDQPKTVRVRFKLHKECAFGQQFLVVGDDPNLGLWEPSDGVPLDWSEGHVWTAEVEMPSSKMISYKFILKEITGTVSWQPGPDRILETWDTAKAISVSEDWESPDSQNIVEEELLVVDDLNESSFNDLGLLIAEDLNQKGEGEGNDVMNEQVGDNEHTSDHSDKASTLMVAENICIEESGEQDWSMSDKGPGPMSEGKGETTLGDHSNSSSLKNETRLVVDEGIPVLVPGLATMPPEVVEAEEVKVKPEAKNIVRTTTTASDETVEASTTAFNESEDSTDLVKKKKKKKKIIVEDTTAESDETEAATEREIRVSASLHRAETSEVMAVEDKPQLNGKNQTGSNVLEIDMQWGRRTLQKFLANLGFMQHS